MNIDKSGIEQFILKNAREQLLASEFQERLQKALEKELKNIFPDIQGRRNELKGRIRQSDQKMSSLLSLVEKGIKVDTIVDRVKTLEAEKAELTKALRELQHQEAGKENLIDLAREARVFVEEFVERFNDLTLTEQKEGMRKLVKQVIVNREKKVAGVTFAPSRP